jgi:NADH-quinone oxidoreductase subunit J
MFLFELFIKFFIIFLGLCVINFKNPVYSVLSLILLFLSSAVLLIYLGASFLGMVFLVVYIGAVAVLFLFVVMMINIRYVELTSNELYYLPINGLLFLLPFSLQLLQYLNFYEQANYDKLDYMKLLATMPDSEVLGVLLYSFEYSLTVIIAALILFVAMVGSIVLTYSSRYDVKKQDIYDQLSSGFETSVNIYDVELPVKEQMNEK